MCKDGESIYVSIMDFKDHFKKIPRRERDGSRSANRFHFQVDWAICEILRLHETEDDYCVLFEVHDDVVVLDSSDNPLNMHFYQVKTKEDGNWTWHAITNRKKLKNSYAPSIIAKMIENGVNFEKTCSSINFVSNARYEFELDGQSGSAAKWKIGVEEILPSLKRNLLENTRHELSLKKDYDFNKIIFFHVTHLSLNEHSVHVKGKICEFIQNRLPNQRFRVDPFYQTLQGEALRKTELETTETEFDELVRLKGLSKKDFTKILNVSVSPDTNQLWLEIHGTLSNERISAGKIKKIKNAWHEYEIHRVDPSNLIVQKLKQEILAIVKSVNDDDDVTFTELMNKAKSCGQAHEMFAKNQLREYYLEAMILLEYAEFNEQPKLQDIDSQFKEEEG